MSRGFYDHVYAWADYCQRNAERSSAGKGVEEERCCTWFSRSVIVLFIYLFICLFSGVVFLLLVHTKRV